MLKIVFGVLKQALCYSLGLKFWETFSNYLEKFIVNDTEFFKKKFKIRFFLNFLLLATPDLIGIPKCFKNIFFAVGSGLYLCSKRNEENNKEIKDENKKCLSGEKSQNAGIFRALNSSVVIFCTNFLLSSSTLTALLNRRFEFLPFLFFQNLLSFPITLSVNYAIEKYAPDMTFEERKNLDFLAKNVIYKYY